MKLSLSQLNRNGGHRMYLSLGVLLMISLLFVSVLPGVSQAGVPSASRKEAVLKEARGLMDQHPTNADKLREAISLLEGYAPQFSGEVRIPLYLAEAYYRLADPAADVSRELPYYEKTESYAKKVLEMDPNRAEAHYWYGLALLKKAQEKGGIGAYFLAKEGIKELETVRRTRPDYDHAGAARVLGLLYCLAPGWTPFGNLDKSIAMGQEATRLAPNFPLNRLYLANAYKKRGDKDAAIKEYQKLLADAAKQLAPQEEDFAQQARTSLRSLGYPI